MCMGGCMGTLETGGTTLLSACSGHSAKASVDKEGQGEK